VLIGVDKVKALFFEWAQVLLVTVCSRGVLAVGYSLPYIINSWYRINQFTDGISDTQNALYRKTHLIPQHIKQMS